MQVPQQLIACGPWQHQLHTISLPCLLHAGSASGGWERFAANYCLFFCCGRLLNNGWNSVEYFETQWNADEGASCNEDETTTLSKYGDGDSKLIWFFKAGNYAVIYYIVLDIVLDIVLEKEIIITWISMMQVYSTKDRVWTHNGQGRESRRNSWLSHRRGKAWTPSSWIPGLKY